MRSNGETPEFGGAVSSLSAHGEVVAFSSSANDLTPDDTHEGGMGRDVFVRDRARATTTRVSVASDGSQGDGESDEPSISGDGRFVAFSSYASNFVVGDRNGNSDVFVRDRRAGTTTLVSVASNGAQAMGWSGQPAISASGRFVAFTSLAWNLAPGRGLNHRVYVHDRRTHRTVLVSAAHRNSSDPSISADGRVIAFSGTSSIHVHDRRTRRTTRVDRSSSERRANGASSSPSISGTGRFVAFASEAGNLVAGDRNRGNDIFVRDRAKGTTSRVSLRPRGGAVERCPRPRPEDPFPPLCPAGPAISASGRYVVFYTELSRFDDAGVRGGVFLRDRRTRRTVRISFTSTGQAAGSADAPAISADGRYAAFRRDGIFLYGPLR